MIIVKTTISFFVILLLGFGIYYGITFDGTIKEQIKEIDQKDVQDFEKDLIYPKKIGDNQIPQQLESLKNQIVDNEWFWVETVENEIIDLNPRIIKPKKQNIFSIKFTQEGNLIGKTDCNNFSGEYVLKNQKVEFGSFMSTLMYCENSQEQEFVSMIQNGILKVDREYLRLITDHSIISFRHN